MNVCIPVVRGSTFPTPIRYKPRLWERPKGEIGLVRVNDDGVASRTRNLKEDMMRLVKEYADNGDYNPFFIVGLRNDRY